MEDLKQVIYEIRHKKKGSFLFFLREEEIDQLKERLKKELFDSKSEQIFDWVESEDSKISQVKKALIRMSEKKLKNYRVFFLADLAFIDKIVQNTLLKPLEEVRTGQIYILVSSSEESVLGTIRSRCQKIHLFFGRKETVDSPFFLKDKKIKLNEWVNHKPKTLSDLRWLLWQWVLYLKSNSEGQDIFSTILDAYLAIKKINVHLELFWINLYFHLRDKI